MEVLGRTRQASSCKCSGEMKNAHGSLDLAGQLGACSLKPATRLAVVCCLLSVVCLWAVSAQACPGCSEALFDPAQGAARVGTLRGYLVSIVVLLGVPVLMIGGMAMAVVRASRRARRGRSIVDTHGT